MAEIIPVTIHMQDAPDGPVRDVVVAGELLAPGLAITPGVDDDDSFHGGWTITHTPSGRLLFPVSVCLACLRMAARKVTEAGIDWTRSMESLVGDPAVVRAVKDFAFSADACVGEVCSALSGKGGCVMLRRFADARLRSDLDKAHDARDQARDAARRLFARLKATRHALETQAAITERWKTIARDAQDQLAAERARTQETQP